jgi:glycosyltransferase involved in cell wall biosynthesis
MRYAWSFYEEYFGDNRLKTLLTRPLLAALRMWDRRASRRVDHFVAISRHVQERIRQFYGREAGVVYPPVDTGLWTPDPDMNPGGAFDLAVSALVPYKRVDLAVRAYTRSGRPLKIIGAGTESDRLRAMAGPNIEFLGWQTDAQILKNYRQCRLLVFPGEEDFGIVPLEAQACGKPVVAYGRGGARETIVEKETGIFFHQQTEEALLAAIDQAAARAWDAQAIRRHAEKFGIDSFISGMEREIARCLDGRAGG